MAIKIIKNTMVAPIEIECGNCRSIFSFNYEDIKTETLFNVFGMKYTNRYVKCPVCKSKVEITRSEVGREKKSDDGATEGNNQE